MASQIVRKGQADLVIFAREFLRRPYWPLEEASELGVSLPWPAQYLRAAPNKTSARVEVNPKLPETKDDQVPEKPRAEGLRARS
jgi:2,4-dienoyl-CoA reductase-like NADH-dependent reductase (Old Yellow Enzyme family)